jgi:hypothetical protein
LQQELQAIRNKILQRAALERGASLDLAKEFVGDFNRGPH